MKFGCLLTCLLVTIHSVPPAMGADRERSPERGSAVGFGAAVLVHDGSVFVSRTGISTRFDEPISQTGGVHVYRKSGGGWEESAEFYASDGVFGDYFGKSISASGATIAVGAPLRGSASGAVYLFEAGEGSSSEAAQLAAPQPSAGDSLGWSVAMSGRLLAAGAPGASSGSGSVYLFEQSSETGEWMHTATLASPLQDRSAFGFSVSIEGKFILVGAPGANGGTGAAVVYEAHDDGWTEIARLTGEGARDFGYAVEVGSGIAAVGAPGAGSVYMYDTAEWMESAKLRSPVAQTGSYGGSVALNGQELWIGATGTGTSGTVYRYEWADELGWGEAFVVIPYPLPQGAGYGEPIDVTGNVAAMGLTNVDFGSGRAYIFERTDREDAWEEAAIVTDLGFELSPVTGERLKCEDGMTGVFSCSNVELLSFLPVSEIGGEPGVTAADIWGWTDPETNREYALANRSDGTAFVDITDPVNPVYLGNLPKTPGTVANIWRDVKTYKNYAFIVADNVGEHGMQVFDLTILRKVKNPPVTFEPTALYSGIHSAHNVIVNEGTGFAYIVGADGRGISCGGELHMVDIRDPLNPTFAGCFNHVSIGQGVHDSQCVVYHGPDQRYTGLEICFSSNGTALSIADVTDKENPVALSAATYPSVGYAHQGWLTDDHKYFYQDDEGDELNTDFGGTRTMVWDVTELDDPVLVTEFINPNNRASDHNLYVKGDLMYQSNYVGGLRIIDISDRDNPREVGHLDTVPFGDDAPGFAGAWSNYPFFESGSIIVSSIREGLFVVKKADEVVP